MISEIIVQGDPYMRFKYTCSGCGRETPESYGDDMPDDWTAPIVGRIRQHRCPVCPYVKPSPPPPPVVVRSFYPNANQEGAE